MDQLKQHVQNNTDQLSPDQLNTVVGGIMSYVKAHVNADEFDKIASAIPGTHDLVAKAETDHATSRDAPAEGGGGGNSLLNSAIGMYEKASGGGASGGSTNQIGSMVELLGFLSKSGIDSKQIMTVLPIVLGFLNQHAGVDVASAVGTPAITAAPAAASGGEATGEATTTTTSGTNNNEDVGGDLMGKASGFMSSFAKK